MHLQNILNLVHFVMVWKMILSWSVCHYHLKNPGLCFPPVCSQKLSSTMIKSGSKPWLCYLSSWVIILCWWFLHNLQCSALVACWCRQVMAVTLRATALFVLMHSGIVNGYQLLFNAHTVLEPHRGTAAFFFFTHYCRFPLFLFMCMSLWQSFSWVPL